MRECASICVVQPQDISLLGAPDWTQELQHLELMTRASITIAQNEEATTERLLLTKQPKML